MHLAVEARLGDDVRAIRLQRAAVVVQAHAGHPADQPVRDPRREPAHERCPGGPCRQPLTTSYPSSSFASRRGMSAGSFCRSPSIGMTMSPAAWSKPAAIAAVWPKLRRSLISLTRRPRPRAVRAAIGVVAASVVDDDDLVAPAERAERRRERVVERRDVVLLVVHGDDDRQIQHLARRGSMRPACRSWVSAAGLPWGVPPCDGPVCLKSRARSSRRSSTIGPRTWGTPS